MSKRSLEILIPTIRSPGSEIWFSWNPERPEDPVEEFFEEMKRQGDEDFALVDVTYQDNPFCPEEATREAQRLQRVDPDMHEHIWLGGYNRRSAAQVLSGKWRVAEFEPQEHWDGPYFGADWGFAVDPTVLVRFWIADNRLYIEQEAYSPGVDLIDTPRLFDEIKGARDYTIRADGSRPETISHMRRAGFRIQAAPMWPGSVEDGVAWLRGFEEIVIHENCTHAIDEARHWCYKVDRITGDPLPKLLKGNDHIWDAVRYGGSPMIKQREVIFSWG